MNGIGKTQPDLRAMNFKETPSSKLSDDFPISFLYMKKMSVKKIYLLSRHPYVAELTSRLTSTAPLNLCSFPNPMSSMRTITISPPQE